MKQSFASMAVMALCMIAAVSCATGEAPAAADAAAQTTTPAAAAAAPDLPRIADPDENLLGNPRFSESFTEQDELLDDGAYDTGNSWSFLLFDGAQAEYTQADDALRVDIAAGGPNTWSVQLMQAPVEVRKGTEYLVQFTAWAEEEREIEIKIGGSGGRSWTPYNPGQGGDAGGQMIPVSPEPSLYTFTFTMMQDTDTDARFEFELGGQPGTVWIGEAGLNPVGTADVLQEEIDIRSYLNREWTLEFEDDFSGDAVDTETWSFEIGNGHSHGIPGWGNAELQYYTDEEQNAFIRDNHLVIRALEDVREDEFGTYSYTSARMISQDSVSVQYGRIDVRARLPHGQGIWPAVWMLGANLPEVGWPASGEIDIMEYLGHQTDRVHGTIHGPGYSGGGGIGDTYISDGDFSQDFHTFSLIWDEDIIIWLVDDEPFHVVTAEHVRRFYNADWVFNQEFFFILNMAVGGHWPGNPDDTTSFPQEMEIDYIRVYTPVE